ncbi:MAG: hypothetical protein AB7N76_09080 [Planctomycetota bacterium]
MSTAPLTNGSNPAHAGGPAAFGRLLDGAVRERGRLDAPAWSLGSGELAPQLLCRYAAGSLTTAERSATQELLARHPWALTRVSRLVQGKRPGAGTQGPLVGSILSAATAGEVDPYRVAASVALRALDLHDAADALERGDNDGLQRLAAGLDGAPRALCALGTRQLEAARTGLAPVASPEVLALAARVATLEDEDEALVELLQAI